MFAYARFYSSVLLLCIVGFFALSIGEVMAGFGITPPYVRNVSLTRNSIYEQQILLVRGNPNVDQLAEVVFDAPEVQDWIEVLEGDMIELPRGVQKVPMTVRVTVPSDAEFKSYSGSIRIRTLPADGEMARGAVSISLGALVDLELTVLDKEIKDFRVRKISVSELNEGTKFGWLYYPGKIRFALAIENTGNVDVAPSKVEMRIFNRDGTVLLEETENIGRIDRVPPFATQEVVAELPTRLPAGSYIARYRIFNDEEIKQEGDLSLSIRPAGTVQAAGFGFIGLSTPHKISILLPIFTVLIAALYVGHNIQKRRRKRDVSVV
jgi:hypothetical protein